MQNTSKSLGGPRDGRRIKAVRLLPDKLGARASILIRSPNPLHSLFIEVFLGQNYQRELSTSQRSRISQRPEEPCSVAMQTIDTVEPPDLSLTWNFDLSDHWKLHTAYIIHTFKVHYLFSRLKIRDCIGGPERTTAGGSFTGSGDRSTGAQNNRLLSRRSTLERPQLPGKDEENAGRRRRETKRHPAKTETGKYRCVLARYRALALSEDCETLAVDTVDQAL